MIYSAPSPVTAGDRQPTVRVAMLTRHAVSVMNRRAVQIKFGDSSTPSKDFSRALAAFVRALTTPWSPLARVRGASGNGVPARRR